MDITKIEQIPQKLQWLATVDMKYLDYVIREKAGYSRKEIRIIMQIRTSRNNGRLEPHTVEESVGPADEPFDSIENELGPVDEPFAIEMPDNVDYLENDPDYQRDVEEYWRQIEQNKIVKFAATVNKL